MFQVVRTYGKSYSRTLWKVESRLFPRKELADDWCRWCQKEWDFLHPRTPSKFFVVELHEPQT